MSSTCTQAGVAADAPAGQTLYPAGSQQSFKGPEAYFTGEVRDCCFPARDSPTTPAPTSPFSPAPAPPGIFIRRDST
ncbi:MAG: hypothetical protein R3F40_14330 [Candidatus Competibacteraceae bacterium]